MKQARHYWIGLFFLWFLPAHGLLGQPAPAATFVMGQGTVAQAPGLPKGQSTGYRMLLGPSQEKSSYLIENQSDDSLQRGYLEQAGLEYQFHFFREPWVRRWHVATLRTDWQIKGFPVLAKINAGRLAGRDIGDDQLLHLQYQVDAYPRITASDYLYLSAAYSGSSRFPDYYLGADWYHSFERGFEASLGLRWLQWRESVVFYTGSAAKYLGNYWFSLRAYLTPSEEFTGQTWTLSARRYLATGEDYVGLKLEYGTSPESLITIVDYPDIKGLRSTEAHLSYQRRLQRWLVRTEAGYRREEYRENTFRHHMIFRLHLLYQFNR